ncbi:hypothetical protein JOD89_004881 [Priestia megaterium]
MKFNISSHLKIAYKIKTQLELNRFLVGFLFYIITILGTKKDLYGDISPFLKVFLTVY